MMNTKPFVFNPDEEPRELLIATFVIRQTIYQKIFKGIQEASRTTPPQHFLLVGQRGMGKTTLLLRVKYAVEDDAELNRYMLVIRFPEEQYNIANLPDLWEETARYLENMDTAFEGILDELEAHEKKDDYERVAFDLISSKLKQQNKRILFLIDNVGDLLKKFTDQENHRLREILMTSPHLQLLGASSEMLEYNFQYDKPFFEFFYPLKLQPLNKREAVDLMKTLGANYGLTDKIEAILNNTPERVEVLRRITGGVPRTLVLLFQIFVDYNDGSAFEDLEHLVDKVLPLYKARMDSLKPQQQKIIDALARAWEAIPSADILEQSKLYREGITSNQVSSQLKQLEDNQLVEVVDTGKRKKLYRIRERFFNIWYLMRNGRKQNKEQVLWLIRFLESWCTVEELKDIAFKQIENIRNGKYSEKAAYYKAMALHSIACIDSTIKQELLKHTEGYLLKRERKDWAKAIHDLLDKNSWLQQAYNAYKSGDIVKAESFHLKALKLKEQDAAYHTALFYYDIIKNFEKAENFYLKAIEDNTVEALYELALLYDYEKKDYSKAELYYLKALNAGETKALNNLGLLYSSIKQYDKAEEYLLKAVDSGSLNAIFNLALLYDTSERNYCKAELYYLKAIELGFSDAINNLANLYTERNEFSKAEIYYLKAIEAGDKDALYNLGNLYTAQKDYKKAEMIYLQAVNAGDADALNNLGALYTEEKEFGKAEYYFLKAKQAGIFEAGNNLAILYSWDKNEPLKAEQYFLESISAGDFRTVSNLFYLYWENQQHQKALNFCSFILQDNSIYKTSLLPAFRLSISLLYEEQYHFILSELKKQDSLLSKYLQPIYYVVAWYLQDELPGEYEKAGSEIKQTVDEIIKTVEKRKATELKEN